MNEPLRPLHSGWWRTPDAFRQFAPQTLLSLLSQYGVVINADTAAKITKGQSSGAELVRRLDAADLLSRNDGTQKFAVYASLIQTAYTMRNEIGQRMHGEGVWKSQDLTASLAQSLGWDDQLVRQVLRGLRVDIAGIRDGNFLNYFRNMTYGMLQAYLTLPPSLSKNSVIDALRKQWTNSSNPSEFYRIVHGASDANGRALGVILPFEIDVMAQSLLYIGYGLTPFDQGVLSLIRNGESGSAWNKNSPTKAAYLNSMTRQTGVPVDEHVVLNRGSTLLFGPRCMVRETGRSSYSFR